MVGAVFAAEATQGFTQTRMENKTTKGVNARRNSVTDITLNTPDTTARGRIDTWFAPNGKSTTRRSESFSRRRMLRSDAMCRCNRRSGCEVLGFAG